MIGMNFISFLILLIISVVVSGILHYGFKYYATAGFESFCVKVVAGWFGAWLGSPVFGYWPHQFLFSTTRTFGLSPQFWGRSRQLGWRLISTRGLVTP
jgi:hypothetical protein